MDYRELIDKFKIPFALSLVGIVLIVGGSLFSKNQPKSFPKESIVQDKTIQVDVSGAVNNPGVYSLPEGSRVEDAVRAAGSVSLDANQEYVSKSLNLAQKISDGSKIYIPSEGELAPVGAGQGGVVSGASTIAGPININTGTQAELESLPGIGPVTASKIINSRPYSSVEDLLNQKVVGKAVFEKIKDSIVVH